MPQFIPMIVGVSVQLMKEILFYSTILILIITPHSELMIYMVLERGIVILMPLGIFKRMEVLILALVPQPP